MSGPKRTSLGVLALMVGRCVDMSKLQFSARLGAMAVVQHLVNLDEGAENEALVPDAFGSWENAAEELFGMAVGCPSSPGSLTLSAAGWLARAHVDKRDMNTGGSSSGTALSAVWEVWWRAGGDLDEHLRLHREVLSLSYDERDKAQG